MGPGTRGWSAVDAAILGLEWERVRILRRLLGTAGRFLWWDRLRVRLLWSGL